MSFRQRAAQSKVLSGEQVRSLFTRAVNDRVGTLVHTLGIRAGRALDQAVFDERAGKMIASLREALGEELWDSRSAVFFREQVPYVADSAEAATLCRREMSRPPASATEHQLRIACFEFSDGSTRIIARAHRALIGRHFLLGMVKSLAYGEDMDPMHWDHVCDAAGPVAADLSGFEDFPAVARWTSPGVEPGTCMTEPVQVRGTRHRLIPALLRVLSSFNQGQAFSLPVLIDRAARDGRTPASGAGCQLLALDHPLELGAEAAEREWRARELRPAVWLTPDRMNALAELWGAEQGFLVGLAITEDWTLETIAHKAFQHPPFPVTVLCDEYAEGNLTIGVQYDRAVIGSHSAESLQTCLVNVMETMTSCPGIPLARIPLLTGTEQQATLRLGRSRGPERLLASSRLERRVMELAQTHPKRIAVSDERERLTYGELEKQTNRIARYLIARGVGRGDHVGLCLSRSSRMVVLAMAVLKAGGVYVPIDPDYPADRIAYIREDANLELYIFEGGASPSGQGREAVALAELLRQADTFSEAPPEGSECSLDDPAYMIYTSGSTGRPKGVQVSHRNVLALLGAVERQFALGHMDVWSLFHSFSFDFSVWEMWGALLTGARVHVVPYEVSRNTDAFVDLVNELGVTVLSQTPSAFGQLIAHERRRPVGSHLRLVIFGGEALDTRMLLPWFDRHPEAQCRLINMFGITETTVHVTATEIRRIHALTGSRTVGRPIDGWGVYVLAADQSILPPGVDGEIYVSGSGVALGYHNRPELNQQRFLPDLLGQGRMYRSGDRGRLLPDGELLHLGRLDTQVKLRGFRIELDEIRNVLLRCRGVEAAAALFTQRDGADAATARIDAYVVMKEGSLRDVWSQAMQLLPEYMLPSSLARVSSMPLTNNGKLNTRKLSDRILEKAGRPAPGAELPNLPVASPENRGASDRPDIERHLVEIWTELFARPIGPEDNFFDVGGNSLFAIRLSSKLRQRGLPAINPRDLYMHQTIARLSPVLARHPGI